MADHVKATPLSYLLSFLSRVPQRSAIILRVPRGVATSFFLLASNAKIESFPAVQLEAVSAAAVGFNTKHVFELV